MASNIAQFKSDFANFIATNNSIDANGKNLLRDSQVGLNQQAYLAYRSVNNLPDNTATKNLFVADYTVERWLKENRDFQNQTNRNAIPPPTEV